MDTDLNRSLRLLEESLSVQGKTLLLTGTPKNRKRPKVKPLSSPLASTPEIHRKLDQSALGTSVYESTFNTVLEGDKTLTGSILRVNDPWKTTANSLYVEFYEILQSRSSSNDIFEIIADLARCCSDALQVIKGLKSKASVDTYHEEAWLENERNTWRLLYVLFQDRLSTQNSTNTVELEPYFGVSERICVLNLFKTDNLVRECQLVIDWLEYTASERDVEILHFTDNTVGWENTLHQLVSADTIVFESTKKIVTSLHPDAPHYEGLSLHDMDIEDDNKLCRHVFQEIRCGKLEQAKKLCVSCGHAWKAAMLDGWKLFHNPNIVCNTTAEEDMDTNITEYDSKKRIQVKEEDLQPYQGNANRDLWKTTSYQFCQQDYLNIYERAAIAAYCGNLDTLLRVCKNWEDYLWAYMRVLVDIRVESEIRDCISKRYKPMPTEYWDQKMSLNSVFKCLEASQNPTIRNEAKIPEHVIQKFLILDEMSSLLDVLAQWIEESDLNSQFLRFATHLLLFLEQIGCISRHEVSEKVLELYISKLADMNETNLVAFYVSKLGESKQVFIYASYLERILENNERKEALNFAEDYGLNARAITKQVVENIRSRPHEVGAFGDLQQRVTEVDLLKISAIDWLLIYENQRLEALEQSNALIFTFLTLKKLDAAQLTFNKIPPDSVVNILAEGDLLPDVNQIIKEHLSYKAYLDAQEAFNDWFKQFNSKPMPPEALPENAQFTEKVAHQHRESQYKANTDRWKLTTSHLAKIAKTKLYNVLLFPDGGWLCGAKDGEFLRSACIPEITLLLYSVLYESEQHEECVQLADILAAEKYSLYKVFSKERLGEMLLKLSESSVALLNQKKDPWGNVTTE